MAQVIGSPGESAGGGTMVKESVGVASPGCLLVGPVISALSTTLPLRLVGWACGSDSGLFYGSGDFAL